MQQVSPAAAMQQQVFHFRQPLTVVLELAVAPVGKGADIPPGKAHFVWLAVLDLRLCVHHLLYQQ
nr:hypothetical protein [Photorhabdus luminescens]